MKLEAVAVIIGAGLMVWVFVPFDFWTRSVDLHQTAPNSLGIAAIIRIVSSSRLWWLMLIGVSSILFGLLVARSGPSVISLRTLGFLLIFVVAFLNFGLAFNEVSTISRGAERSQRTYVEWVDEHPKLFGSGLCIDFDYWGAGGLGNARTFYLAAENLERAETTLDPESCLGRLPLVTDEVFDEYVVMFEDEVGGYRMYSTDRVDEVTGAPAPSRNTAHLGIQVPAVALCQAAQTTGTDLVPVRCRHRRSGQSLAGGGDG